MTSGLKTVVFNTRERVVSTDHNLTQTYLAGGMLDILRHQLFDVSQSYSSAPLKAEVLDGLVVLPQAGSYDLKVSAGAMVTSEAPTVSGESVLHLAKMSSELGIGTISLLPNASGSVRVDVIECQRSSLSSVSESRDIRDAATGIAAPATVVKFIESGVNFRVRSNAASSGTLTLAAGWLPICVVRVPIGAGSVDACQFWDVRPLVSARVGDAKRPHNDDNRSVVGNYSYSTAGGTFAISCNSGYFQFTANGRECGGQVPGASIFDPRTDVESLTADRIAYLHAVFPAGLPTWRAYNGVNYDPSAFSGLLVWSHNASAPTGLPAKYPFGLTGLKSVRLCISNTMSSSLGVIPTNVSMSERTCIFSGPIIATAGSNALSATLSISANTGTAQTVPVCSRLIATLKNTWTVGALAAPVFVQNKQDITFFNISTTSPNASVTFPIEGPLYNWSAVLTASETFSQEFRRSFGLSFDQSGTTSVQISTLDLLGGTSTGYRFDTGGSTLHLATGSGAQVRVSGCTL